MHYLDLPHATVLLLGAWLGQGAVAASMDGPHRMLKAAAKRSDLYRRSMRVTKKFESELVYTEEENGWGGRSTFASQVKVKSQKPIMVLEEIEHFLQDVQCEEGQMKLSFADSPSARDALHSCHGKDGGLVITSHDSCNEAGERAVYRVHEAAFADEEGESLALSVTQASWQEAFDHFDISFGHTTDDHVFRRHADFAKIRKRQAPPAEIPAVEIPADTADDVNSVNVDLASELIDTTFEANAFVAGVAAAVGIPDLPVEFGCNNCSTRGQLALTQGAFNIDLAQIDLIPDFLQGGDDGKDLSDVITGGFIELKATGVGARLDLFARPKVSGEFEVTLITLPVVGFVIPGIGKAGATFEPRIAFDFTISGGFQLNYGLDVALPDNSNIRLDLTSLGDSEVNGFAGATLTPLPFTVDVADVDILLGLAFRPVIPVGFEFSNNLKAEVFVSVDLPRLDARLSTDVAAACDAADAGFAAIGPLALVEANISVTVDAGFSLDLPILPAPFDKIEVDANIFSVGFPLITACADAGQAMTTMTATVPDMPTNGNTTNSVTTMYNNGTGISNFTRTAMVSPTAVQLTTVLASATPASNASAVEVPAGNAPAGGAAATRSTTKTFSANLLPASGSLSGALLPSETLAPCGAETTTTVYNATMTVYKTIKETGKSGSILTKSKSGNSTETAGQAKVTHTSTKYMMSKSKSSNSTTASTLVVKVPEGSVETLQVLKSSSTSKLAVAGEAATASVAPGAEDFTFVAATPEVTTFRASSGVAGSSGFFGAANATGTAGLALFTGAAVPGAEVPAMKLGWQFGALGISLVFGVVMLL